MSCSREASRPASVADVLRAGPRPEAALSVTQRVALALELGERDLESYRNSFAPPLAPAEARRRLERKRQAGRARSACMDAIIG